MDHLLTEARLNASAHLDRLSAHAIVQLMNAEDAKVPVAVATQAEAIAHAIDIIAERFTRGGRLVYIGAGTSGRLGVLDASECPPTFNSPSTQVIGIIAGGNKALTTAIEGAEDQPASGVADVQAINLNANDVLVGIATSGRTPYVLGAMQHARTVRAYCIGLACVPDAALAEHADLMLAPLVGPEVLTGSTRLKAGTATKLILNMLTTGAMVRTGKAFGNLMVDLRATNVKLQARTNRIVRHLVGVDERTAAQLLTACQGELKTAIVVGRTGLSPLAARTQLAEAGGLIHRVLPVPAVVQYPQWVLGLDGGGTHTRALLFDGNELLGQGDAGPSNSKAVGEVAAQAALTQAIQAAFVAAGRPVGCVGALIAGIAGAGRAEEQRRIEQWLQENHFTQHAKVVGDVELPLEALPEGWGISVVAGTGSCVFGRTADGRTARAGGWGPLLGDVGSAYELVLATLRAITQHADAGNPLTASQQRFLQAMQIPTPAELPSALHDGMWDRRRLAQLAPLLWENPDEEATAIITAGANGLARMVAHVVRNLGINTADVPLACTGGLLLHGAAYRTMLVAALANEGIRANVILVAEPARSVVVAVRRGRC